MSRQGFFAIAILGGPLLLGMLTGLMQPADVEAHLLLGWMKFLYQTIPRVRLEPGGFLTAGICLVGLTFGGHWFLRWLYGGTNRQPISNEPATSTMPQRWRFKWTIYLLLVVVLTFVGGISAVGIVHQVGWLMAGN